MKKIYILSFLVFTSNFLYYSQVEDPSCLPPSKKYLKKIQEARASSDAAKTSMLFQEVMEAEPDNAMASYEFAVYSYDAAEKAFDRGNSASGDKLEARAAGLFEKTIQLCADYHADCYYYLGLMAYQSKNSVKANEYFEKFINFKSEDATRFPEDYNTKLAQCKKAIAVKKEENAILENAVPFNPILVRNVSTDLDEFFPMISPDNELVFYTRRVDRRGKGELVGNKVEEFTFSFRPEVNIDFDAGKPFAKPFNDGTFKSYGAATFSVDNKEMIICACKDEKVSGQDYRNCDLYSTTYERTGAGGNDFKWSPLKNLGPGINTNDGWEAQPTLSADGNTMYYTAARPTTRDNDIFVVERSADGSWGTAIPFDVLNTAGKDKSPFLHQDSETLYFASSCSPTRKGVGGVDLFYVRRENGKWSEPKNLGYPINTKDDELGLFVSTDGHRAYFSSLTGGTNWNIYSFELYEAARPKAVVIVKGELKDKSGAPIENASIEIAYAGSNEVTKVRVNGNDGKYAAVIKADKAQDVMVTVQKDGYAFDSKLITKEQIAEIVKPTVVNVKTEKPVSIKKNDLAIMKLEVGAAYTLNDILYSTNSAVLNDRSKFILKQFAGFLKANATVTILIQGHTDDQGEDALNLSLSDARAKGVRDYLTSLGVDAKRLKSKGFGELMPKTPNTSESSRAVNRRTDFVIEAL